MHIIQRSLLLILLFASQLSNAANPGLFSGTIKNFYPSFLEIDLGYEYAALPVNTTRLMIDDDGKFEFDQMKPINGFVGFYHFGTSRYIRFWLAPDTQLKTSFDWENPMSSIEFSGQGAKENEVLISIDAKREGLLSSSVSLNQAVLNEAMGKESETINNAFKSGHISFEFHSIMLLDAKFYWMAHGLERGMLSPEEVLNETKLSNSKAIGSMSYFRFLRAFGRKAYKGRSQQERYDAFAEHLSESIMELFWAYDIRQASQEEEIEYSLLEAYQLYVDKFDNGALQAYAHKYLVGLEDQFYRENTPITEEMVFVEDSSLSIVDIVERFKGEVLLFDMWATWCKPCILQMGVASKKPLEEFIKDKPVKIIYLSVDTDRAKERWRGMVKDLRLNSHNYRLNRKQLKEVLTYLGNDTNLYSIPRYFIVNKEGILVNKEAPYPSTKEELYNELAKYF